MRKWILALALLLLTTPLYAVGLVQGAGSCWYDDVVVPGFALRTTGSAPADFAAWPDRSPLYIYRFEADTDEELFASVQMPHGWDGGNVGFHVHWTPTVSSDANPANQKVVWCIDYTLSDINQVFPAVVTAQCGSTTLSASEPVANTHEMTNVVTITPTANQNSGSAILYFRLYRDANSGSDTYEHDAGLTSVDLHYRSCIFGSQTAAPE